MNNPENLGINDLLGMLEDSFGDPGDENDSECCPQQCCQNIPSVLSGMDPDTLRSLINNFRENYEPIAREGLAYLMSFLVNFVNSNECQELRRRENLNLSEAYHDLIVAGLPEHLVCSIVLARADQQGQVLNDLMELYSSRN